MIARILVLILILQGSTGVKARSFKRIPRPQINTERVLVAPNSSFTIEGQGFIENYPQAHRIKLKQGKRRYKAKAISSSANSLRIQTPKNLSYGDYNIEIKIKTRLLRSKAKKKAKLLAVRPKAPPPLRFKHNVINETAELDLAILNRSFNGLPLVSHGQLELGPNQITSTYMRDGWESLESEASSIYYFPKEDMKEALMLESEQPLKTLALTKEQISYDVSSITKHETQDLSKHFYLSTPNYPKYLEHIVNLSPVYIEMLHVKAEEYAVLRNRSSEDFLLENCSLSDSIRTRYEFTALESIPAKQSIKLEANLGLNDSSPDSLTLACQDEEIDSFNYKGLDAEGFGVQEK